MGPGLLAIGDLERRKREEYSCRQGGRYSAKPAADVCADGAGQCAEESRRRTDEGFVKVERDDPGYQKEIGREVVEGEGVRQQLRQGIACTLEGSYLVHPVGVEAQAMHADDERRSEY
jgi:hypothetical protein